MNHFDNSTYYHYKLIFNSKINPKTKRILIAGTVLSIIACTFILIQLYTFYQIPPQKIEVILLQFLIGLVSFSIYRYLSLGIGYIGAGIRPRMQLSTSAGIPLFTWNTENIISKKQKIFILLTPTMLGSGFLILIMAIFPNIWVFSATILAFHAPLCLSDIYWAYRLSKMHPDVAIQMNKHGFSVYKI